MKDGEIKNTAPMGRKRSYLKYLAGLMIFGSNGVIASYIHLSGYEIVLLRSVLGIALLLVLFFITGHRFTAFGRKAAMSAAFLFCSVRGNKTRLGGCALI